MQQMEDSTRAAGAVRPASIPGEDPLDVHRLRSAGPLDDRELAIARVRGLSLAYDPVQIGWVLADCVDDLDPDMGFEASTHAGAAADADTLDLLLEERVGSLLRRMDTHRADVEETAAAIWALPAELLASEASGDSASVLARLRRLQAAAHAALQRRAVFSAGRAHRRHRALIDGHDLVLRPWLPAEAGRFRKLLDDPNVWRHLPETYPDPLTEDMARDLIALSNDQSHHEVRAIEQGGRVVGQIRMLFGVPGAGARETHDAEISYWLGKDHWGQGIVGRAIRLYTLLTFQRRPLESIYARVAQENTASLRALHSAGYRDEGDLAARLDGEGTTRILRCYRADYLDPEPRPRTSSRSSEASGVSAPGRPAAAARL